MKSSNKATLWERVTHCKIHPGIGIARVGNSTEGYLLGPEVPYPVPAPPGGYKDSQGALKRQAARFRIYGYDESGEVVDEITAADAAIAWTVHVANSKAAWYNFEAAMDIPDAIPVPRRNPGITGPGREKLVIDPGPRSVTGVSVGSDGGPPAARFDTGTFLDQPVYLGELRTDEKGRLLFLGGRGVSGTPFADNPAYTFANNDGWHDDVSDGPVSATVQIGDREVPVTPAWIVVAPPNYAPGLVTPVTMYDVLYDLYQNWWMKPVSQISFTRHILPILRPFCDAQWVNLGFHVQFGWDSPHHFLREEFLARLSVRDPNDTYAEHRRQVFNMMRDPAYPRLELSAWPQLYGDTYGSVDPPLSSPRTLLALTKTQYGYLRRWVAGDFTGDLPPGFDPDAPQGPEDIDAVPLAQRPETLDRAALHFCMGGPFHPGCELTWPLRHRILYSEPFRIRPRAAGQPVTDFGDVLTPAAAVSESGPLQGSGPGDLTRWMAVPWQTDTASCRAGYQRDFDPYLPTFWPARVPNHVLAETEYARATTSSLPKEQRAQAFQTRSSWLRGLKHEGQFVAQINQMITDFGELGVLERRERGEDPDGLLPPVLYVETGTQYPAGQIPHDQNLLADPEEKIGRPQRQMRRFAQTQVEVVTVARKRGHDLGER